MEDAPAVAAETMTDAPEPALSVEVSGYSGAARAHIFVALGSLFAGVMLALVASTQLVLPDAFSGVGMLSYGRVLPTATNVLIYGWLTIGLIGASYYIVPRLAGVELQFEPLARVGAVLLAIGVLAGAGGIDLGWSEGRTYLEMPLFADFFILLGLLIAVRVITATISDRTNHEMGPALWFLGAAPLWLLFAFVVGNIPGLVGINSVIQTAFYRGALAGLWLSVAGFGLVYYLIPKVTGGPPARPTKLAVMGFWSLGFVWAFAGAADLTYTPAPSWLQTIGVVFSIALFLPLAMLFTDLVGLMRGRWGRARNRMTIRFIGAGAILLLVMAVINLLQALRASSAVVGYTTWGAAFEYAAFYGAFTLWLAAFIYDAAGDLLGGVFKPSVARAHYRLTTLSLTVLLATTLIGGLQTGFLWISDANTPESTVAYGAGWKAVVESLQPHYWIMFFAVVLFAFAQVRFTAGGVAAAVNAQPAEPEPAAEDDAGAPFELPGWMATNGVTARHLWLGSTGVFALAALLALLLPTLEPAHVDGTILSDSSRNYNSDEFLARGRGLYLSEGCWYCHTQDVRPIVTDVDLGAVSQPGDYAHEVPALLGTARIGPDLMHAAGREEAGSSAFVLDHLTDPRVDRPWSIMPSYDYLSENDRLALVAYITSLD
jgi:cytochrome c oxidase cbb3-type subunit I/II